MRCSLLVIVCCLLVGSQILAVAQEETPSPTASVEGSSVPKLQDAEQQETELPTPYELPPPAPALDLGIRDIGRVFFALLIVIGVLFGAVYLLKRGWRPASTDGSASSDMRVLSRLYLGPKKQLYLVEMPQRVLLLGVTDQQISLLSEITDEQEVLALKRARSAGISNATSFLQQLRNSMARTSQATPDTELTVRKAEQSLSRPSDPSDPGT